MASCFPDPWWWDFEGGTSSILFPNIRVSKPENYGDIVKLLGVAQKITPEYMVAMDGQQFTARTIVMDTVGEFCRVLINSAKGSREQAQLQDWGLSIERARNITRQMRDLRDKGMHIVFLCHEQYLKQDETSAILGLPDLPGKELPNDLPKLCDFVVHMSQKQTSKGMVRNLATDKDGLFIGRDRQRLLQSNEELPPFTAPDAIKALLAKAGVK